MQSSVSVLRINGPPPAQAARGGQGAARRQRGGRMGAAERVGYRVGGHHPAARSSSASVLTIAAHGASAEGGWVLARPTILRRLGDTLGIMRDGHHPAARSSGPAV